MLFAAVLATQGVAVTVAAIATCVGVFRIADLGALIIDASLHVGAYGVVATAIPAKVGLRITDLVVRAVGVIEAAYFFTGPLELVTGGVLGTASWRIEATPVGTAAIFGIAVSIGIVTTVGVGFAGFATGVGCAGARAVEDGPAASGAFAR